MSVKFIVHQDAATRLWHWRLRSAANDRDWAVSGIGYTRKERAIAACELVWSKLAAFSRCPRIQVNAPQALPSLDLFAPPRDMTTK